MGLITSVAEAQAMLRAANGASDSQNTSATGFSDILKQSFANISEDMDAIFEEAAAKFQISPQLLKSVAKAESNFNPNAVSHAGAMGVMQLMPGTAKNLGVTDAFDARQNIMGGAKYLKENLDRFGGNVELALAAYNAGPGAVQKYGGIPPYKETQNYVKKVTSYMGGDALFANKSVTTGGSSYSSGSFGGAVSLAGAVGLNSYGGLGLYTALNGYGGSGDYASGLGSYVNGLSGLNIQQDGDTITMDKDAFASLIQIVRIQMMMNADQQVGFLNF